MITRMRFSVGLMLLALFALQSCHERPIDPWDPGNGGGGGAKPTPMAAYYGVQWTLTSVRHMPVTDDRAVTEEKIPADQLFTIMFQPSHVMGQADCNQYRAECKLSENALAIMNYGSSKVLCRPESFDKRFAEYLGYASSYTVNEKELEIYCPANAAGDTYVLRFTRSDRNDGGNDGGGNDNTLEFLPLIPMPRGANMPPSTRDIQIESVSVDKHLVVAYNYSGGCAPVHFRFYADPADMSTPEDGITVHMMTDGEPDMCLAMVYGKKMVDLSLVRSHLPDYTKPEPVKFTVKYNGREYEAKGYIQ